MRKAADPIGFDGSDVLGAILEVLGGIDLLVVVLDLEASGLLFRRVSSIFSSLAHTKTHTPKHTHTQTCTHIYTHKNKYTHKNQTEKVISIKMPCIL